MAKKQKAPKCDCGGFFRSRRIVGGIEWRCQICLKTVSSGQMAMMCNFPDEPDEPAPKQLKPVE